MRTSWSAIIRSLKCPSKKYVVSPLIHTEVVDHGAAGGDDVALLYVHVVAVARDDRVEHLRLLRVLLPQEGPFVTVPHLPAGYNLACILKSDLLPYAFSVFRRNVSFGFKFQRSDDMTI